MSDFPTVPSIISWRAALPAALPVCKINNIGILKSRTHNARNPRNLTNSRNLWRFQAVSRDSHDTTHAHYNAYEAATPAHDPRGEGGCGHYATVDSQKQTEPMHKSPAHCMTRQKCKSTGKRHIARARSEQCTLPLQANMQHPAELPQRGDADLSLARWQDMKVPHGQPRWPQPTKTRKRDAPTSPPWTRCRCCRRSRQRPGCATGPSRWGPLMLPFGLGSKAHLSCGRPQTSEVMAVKLDSFTEAGGRGLQGGSAGKPAHLAAVEVPRRGPVREWPK